METKTKTITKKNTLKLIKGTYSDVEAREILLNLFTSKINFHQMKNFSNEERFGKSDEAALTRITELKQSVIEIKTMLEFAKLNQMKLTIKSEVSISLE